jgi:predicted ATPase
MLRSRRQQIHSRIATTLEDQFPEIVIAEPQLIAQHCAEAGLDKKAVGYRLKAGQQAVARSAMTEAVAQLRKGLDQLANLPDNSSRQQQELDLQIALAPALIGTKGYSAPDVSGTITRAHELAVQLDRTEYLVPLLYGQWVFNLVRSELKLSLSYAEQMEELGDERSDAAVLLMGHNEHAIIRFFFGEFTAARALFEQCYDLDDPAHRAVYANISPDDPYTVMLAYLGATLSLLGYIDEGHARLNDALLKARQPGYAHTLCLVLRFAAWVEWLLHSPREEQRYADELVALSEQHGFPLWLGWGTAHRGSALIALNEAQEGLSLITKGRDVASATGAVLLAPFGLMLLAGAHAKLGRPAEATKFLSEAMQIISKTDERYQEADLYRLRADLLVATGDSDAAEQNYHQAVSLAERQCAKTLELRAATSLARLWRDQGKRDEARDLLAPVYGWFTEGFDTPVLIEAKALLDELA